MLKRLREDRAVTRRLSFPYVLALPQDYDALPDKRWPLVVMLHGAGERGDDYDVLCRHGFLRRAAAGEEFPFLLAAPQCPADKYWGGYIESLNDFLDGLLDRLRGDADRVYLTGLSMGGTGTWLWAMANPERFAAIAPVCGTGICWYGEALRQVPVWCFHGDKDDTVPLDESVRMVERVNERGGSARLTVFEGVGHDSWERAYAGSALVDWLLSHRKG